MRVLIRYWKPSSHHLPAAFCTPVTTAHTNSLGREGQCKTVLTLTAFRSALRSSRSRTLLCHHLYVYLAELLLSLVFFPLPTFFLIPLFC